LAESRGDVSLAVRFETTALTNLKRCLWALELVGRYLLSGELMVEAVALVKLMVEVEQKSKLRKVVEEE